VDDWRCFDVSGAARADVHGLQVLRFLLGLTAGAASAARTSRLERWFRHADHSFCEAVGFLFVRVARSADRQFRLKGQWRGSTHADPAEVMSEWRTLSVSRGLNVPRAFVRVIEGRSRRDRPCDFGCRTRVDLTLSGCKREHFRSAVSRTVED
jgi:hypothetical protein